MSWRSGSERTRLASAGVESPEIARVLAVSRLTVPLWRERSLALRLAGSKKDAPRPGRLPRLTEDRVPGIVDATLQTTQANAMHWTTRTKTFKLSRDEQILEELHDAVGLYANPPDRALVLCGDEESRIQALDRTLPGSSLANGSLRHHDHEFIRLLDSLEAETPAAIDLRLIIDNDATHTHTHAEWRAGSSFIRRVHLHLPPHREPVFGPRGARVPIRLNRFRGARSGEDRRWH